MNAKIGPSHIKTPSCIHTIQQKAESDTVWFPIPCSQNNMQNIKWNTNMTFDSMLSFEILWNIMFMIWYVWGWTISRTYLKMVSWWLNPLKKWTLTQNNSRLRCQCDFALWQVLLRQLCHLSQTKMHISQVERKCLLFSQTAWCPCHSPLLPCQRAQLILKDSAASRISQLEFITQFTPQLNSIPPTLPPFT